MARVVLVLPLLLSGCVTELLGPDDATTLTTTCAVLDREEYPEMRLYVHQSAPAPTGVSDWVSQMLTITGRDAIDVRVRDGPPGPWTQEAMQDWIEEQQVIRRARVSLHVVWVPELASNVENWAPGIVALNASAVQASDAPSQAGRALLFHGLGHALGVVNAGIPLSTPESAHREGPQHHEPVPHSVMHAGWHRVDTMPRNVTLAYSDAIVADWQRATQDGGACIE